MGEPGNRWKVIYKITFPNGKIYVGQDRTDNLLYMGSVNRALVDEDFPPDDREARRDYLLRKEILWESDSATDSELTAREVELIRETRSNDPTIGYNRWPPFRPASAD